MTIDPSPSASKTNAGAAKTAQNEIDAATALAILLGVVFLFGLFAAFDVPVVDTAKYLLFLAFFVAMPGISVLSLLRGPDGPSLMDLGVVAMPLGTALGSIGFVVCSALGVGWLGPYASLIAGLVCALFSFKRLPIPTFRFRLDRKEMRVPFALLLLLALGVLLSAFEFFPAYPLPEHVPPSGVVYQDDMSWHIGNTASLKTFWPPADPRMVDYPLRYYISFHIHAAMASLVTHIDPAIIILRLAPSLFIAQIGISLFLIGRSFTARAVGGLLAVFLGLIASDLSCLLGATRPKFLNLFTYNIFLSPTYALGVLTMGPTLLELSRYFSDEKEERSRLPLIFLLLIGLGFAKLPALPVPVAACAGMLGLDVLRTRHIAKKLLKVFLVSALAMALVFPFLIFKSGGGYVRLSPLSTIFQIPAYPIVLGGNKGGALTAPLRAIFSIFAFAPLLWIGFWGSLKNHIAKENIAYRFLSMVVLAGGSAVLLFDGAGLGQIWFWLYGSIALIFIASKGLLEIWKLASRKARSVWAIVLCLLSIASAGSSALRAWTGLAITIGARAVPMGPLTPERVEAYRWIRDHTQNDALLAIDQQSQLYGSAITERRFLLENDDFMTSAYLYRFSGGKVGSPPNQELRALTRRVFEERDEAALQEMKTRYGVRYLIDDKKENAPMKAFDAARAKLVFSNGTVDVYAIAP